MSEPVSAFSVYASKKKNTTKTAVKKNKSTVAKSGANKKHNIQNGKKTVPAKKNMANGKNKSNKRAKDTSCSTQDDDSYDSDEYDSDDSSEDSKDCDCTDCGTHGNEYTLNSYSDDDDDDDDEDESVAKNSEVFSLDKLKSYKKKTDNKRKSNESTVDTKAPKQAKATTNGKVTANKAGTTAKSTAVAATKTAVTNGRKSLPATIKPTKTVTTTKTARRSLDSKGKTAANVVTNSVKLEPILTSKNVIKSDSMVEGLRMFQWLINPLDTNELLQKYWEKNVCLVKREQTNYYSHLISFEAIDRMLLNNHVEFTKNMDITSYKNGIRETLNPEGRALPPVVWDFYGQGCSIRILNPQTFLQPIFVMNAALQEFFHCMVGANVYLTPPNSQGFAPHYDDIEAFVLQIEGRKRWRLYKPRNQKEVLPRYSSTNFKQNEIGKPILDEVLKPGDLLYFPRGTIHQACTEPGYHSLHITISVYQKQSYGDLFEFMLPQILKRAIASNVELRQGVPAQIWRNAGIAFSNNETKERANIIETVSKLLYNTLETVLLPEVVDAAVDEMALRFQHEALPPHLSSEELQRTIFGSLSALTEQGECICDYEFDLRTNVRLLRAHILRLVRRQDDKLSIYFYAHNSKEYKQYEPNYIEIDAEEAGCVEILLRSYPAYIGVAELPIADENRKIEFTQALWERGLLMLENPLK